METKEWMESNNRTLVTVAATAKVHKYENVFFIALDLSDRGIISVFVEELEGDNVSAKEFVSIDDAKKYLKDINPGIKIEEHHG